MLDRDIEIRLSSLEIQRDALLELAKNIIKEIEKVLYDVKRIEKGTP